MSIISFKKNEIHNDDVVRDGSRTIVEQYSLLYGVHLCIPLVRNMQY